MGSFFEQQSKIPGEVKYPDYFLSENPFPPQESLTEGEGEGKDFSSLFCAQIYQREINSLVSSILKSNEQGKKKFWLLKNDKLVAEHNISVVTGLFRALTVLETPRILPAYVPFPVIIREPLGGILQWINDRLNVERFRLSVCAFMYQELKKMHESGEAADKLPSFDVAELLQKIDESGGEAIDEILFIEEPEEAEVEVEVAEETAGQGESKDQPSDKETSAEQDPESDEAESADNEEAEAIKKELEEKKRLRSEFIIAVESKVAKSSFSPQVKSALAVAITKGYEKGRSYIGTGEYRATLKSLLSLIALYHKKTVVILDRLDNWDMLDETQQAAMMGTLTELDWLFGQVGILVLASYERTIEMIGTDFAGMFEKLPLDLWPVTLDLKSELPAEKALDLISYFLKTDVYRKENKNELEGKELPDCFPFTEDGINHLLKQVDGDIGKFLIAAGELLNAGWAKQHAAIDAEFVKNQPSLLE